MVIHLNPLAVVIGLMTIFSFVVATWKLFRFIFKVDRALPTLLHIAQQFESNEEGNSLKDILDGIKTQLTRLNEADDELKVEDRIILKIAEDSRLIADTNAKIVNELAMSQTEDVRHIKDYLHTKLHEINGSIGITNMQANLTGKQLARLEERLDKLAPFIVRHRKSDDDSEAT